MRKQEFLTRLKANLAGLPQKDVDERLGFYSEMIDDRVEEGISEERAVAALGSVEEIASQIIAEIPLYKIVKNKIKPKRRLKTWEIILLALGAPIWFSLLVAAFAVVISVYASLWSIVISLWAVFASLVACAVGGIVGGVVLACAGHAPTGGAAIACGLACVGLAILLFFGCKAATKGIVWLTQKMGVGIKNCFIKGEE